MYDSIMDAKALNSFYGSPVGKYAKRVIAPQIGSMVKGRSGTILGLGYANAYLENFLQKSDSVISVILKIFHKEQWPKNGDNRCVIADEDHLPLLQKSIDVVIIIHALEFVESPWGTMSEINRVVSKGGKILVVVPNRLGLWAKKASTPFGQGRAFTIRQLDTLMIETGFTPIDHKLCVFFPPFSLWARRHTVNLWEYWGKWLFLENGGLIIGCFEKQKKQPILEQRKKYRSTMLAETTLCIT